MNGEERCVRLRSIQLRQVVRECRDVGVGHADHRAVHLRVDRRAQPATILGQRMDQVFLALGRDAGDLRAAA
jgi:hypothetical protein